MDYTAHSLQETLRLGRAIGRHARAGDIICLSGELGAGKTALTKGIAQGLGIDRSEVISPTFVLLRRHEGRLALFHFDFYRIDAPADIAGLGYEEYLYADGVSVIEWPEKMHALLPDQYLLVALRVRGEKERRLRLSARGERYRLLLGSIDEDIRR